jgi:hypothetical protein
MDDNNLSMLTQSQHEWATQIVRLLSPLIIEGVQSVFSEAWALCESEKEEDKYLMQFQNFLARVPKWNPAIVDTEVKRIVEKSGCTYFEDLLSCVHVVHLKILTSIRTGKTQKKIEIQIPKVADFIHGVYINISRVLYTRAYLFEREVPALTFQRNRAELHDLVKIAIMDMVRDSVPVDQLLRAYLDESTDLIRTTTESDKASFDTSEADGVQPHKPELGDTTVKTASDPSADTVKSNTIEVSKGGAPPIPRNEAEPDAPNPPLQITAAVTPQPAAQYRDPEQQVKATAPLPMGAPAVSLSFSDVDRAVDASRTETAVSAPKDLRTLEKISTERYAQRAAEEDDDDKIVIHESPPTASEGVGVQGIGDGTASAIADVMEVLA